MAGDPVLGRVRHALTEMYGDTIDRIVLFGSRTRGEAREGSGRDVAVFPEALDDCAARQRRLGELRFTVLEHTGQLLNIKASAAETHADRIPLMSYQRSDVSTAGQRERAPPLVRRDAADMRQLFRRLV